MNVRGTGMLNAAADPKRPVDTVRAEALASENGGRLAAQQRTEKNIEALSAELNQTFHRLRQSSMGDELFDAIAGFNALSIKTRLLRYEPND